MESKVAVRIAKLLEQRMEAELVSNRGPDTAIEKLVIQAFEPLKLEREELIERVTAQLKDQMHDDLEQNLRLNRVFENLREFSNLVVDRAYNSMPDSKYRTKIESRVRKAGKLKSNLRGLEAQIWPLDQALNRSTLPSIQNLLKEYRPKYLPKDCHDHGLASAVLALRIKKTAQSVASYLNAEPNDPLSRYARIALRIGDQDDVDELGFKSDVLMTETIHAIAVHNLYPAEMNKLGKKDFRVTLSREPFAYFAMLMDALQSWDRDKRLWQNRHDMPYKTAGDRINIRIVGDVIHVEEHDTGLDINSRANAIKNGLDTYLQGASEFIWLELGQWRQETR